MKPMELSHQSVDEVKRLVEKISDFLSETKVNPVLAAIAMQSMVYAVEEELGFRIENEKRSFVPSKTKPVVAYDD